mgnify:CR=1 FL=1
MKIRYWLLAMSFIFLSCGRVADDVEANYGIIPMPNELAPMQGVYVLQGKKISGLSLPGVSRDESFSLFGGCVEKHFCNAEGYFGNGKGPIFAYL